MKPIMFNTDMVQALLSGRKTVTRRVVKGADTRWNFDGMEIDPAMTKVSKSGEEYPVDMLGLWAVFESDGPIEYPMIRAPYQPGNILYVRETWCEILNYKDYRYKATDNKPFFEKWRPSIHMPKKAARIFLRVTGVRVERLQDISDDEAEKEGCQDYASTALGFAYLWDRTIKSADRTLYGWKANPWCWVIEFERISKEEVTK